MYLPIVSLIGSSAGKLSLLFISVSMAWRSSDGVMVGLKGGFGTGVGLGGGGSTIGLRGGTTNFVVLVLRKSVHGDNRLIGNQSTMPEERKEIKWGVSSHMFTCTFVPSSCTVDVEQFTLKNIIKDDYNQTDYFTIVGVK